MQKLQNSNLLTRLGLNFKSLLIALAALLPCLVLLNPRAGFFMDWNNHQWMVGYFGDFLRHHGWMPETFETNQIRGMGAPIFYGHLFYPALGALAALFDPNLVLKIAAFLLYFTQIRLLDKALRALGWHTGLALALSALMTWAIYPMTNLYNRGALTEFFAAGLLTCSVALGSLVLSSAERLERRRYLRWYFFILCLSAGSHFITALYSLPIHMVLLFLLVQQMRKRGDFYEWSTIAIGVALTSFILAPWVWVVQQYYPALSIGHQISHVFYWMEWTELPRVRFYPIPFDPRIHDGVALNTLPTPYLDAQTHVPLLILYVVLFGFVAFKKPKAAWIGMIWLAVFALISFASLAERTFNHLPEVMRSIQFAYRLITYQNLALVMGVLLMSRVGSMERVSRGLAILVSAILIWAGASVGIKLNHATKAQTEQGARGLWSFATPREVFQSLPDSFYAKHDYSMPGKYERLDLAPGGLKFLKLDFAPDQSSRVMQLDQDTWVATNVQSSNWMHMSLDGVEVRPDQIRVQDSDSLAVMMPIGLHSLGLEWKPPLLWRVSRQLGYGVFFVWLLVLI